MRTGEYFQTFSLKHVDVNTDVMSHGAISDSGTLSQPFREVFLTVKIMCMSVLNLFVGSEDWRSVVSVHVSSVS